MSFIDIHSHILPAMDDGPRTIEESLKMVEIARGDGISHIFATPHMIDGLTTFMGKEIRESIDRFRQHISAGIEICYGADVRIVPDLPERIERREVLTLNGSAYVLIEFPEYVLPLHIDTLIFRLRSRGFVPILTHPERHARLMSDIGVLHRLREGGLMLQVTAMSITGEFGGEIRQGVKKMIKNGLVDFAASDSHDPHYRVPVLSRAYAVVKKEFGSETADRIFFDNPAKILEDRSKTL